MFFASDNGGPVHPRVMDAVTAANDGYAVGYGKDPLSREVTETLRDLFEAPEAAIYLVPTGTAANALILGTLSQPWQTIFCTPTAHIHVDECNAPEFYTGGAKLTLTEAENGKMTAATLGAALDGIGKGGVQGPQHGPVSVTQVTEMGTLYSLAEIAAICDVAGAVGVPVHLDGARFANACAALGCTPAEMTWKAGVDAVSFGGTKNGCMGVEAAVIFDPAKAWEFELRRKRGAHLFSKHRYLAAQMQGYLSGELWLEMAAAANARAAYLAEGMRNAGIALAEEPQANMIFARLPHATHRRLQDAGAVYYIEDGDPEAGPDGANLTGRFVCDWSIPLEEIDRFLQVLVD